MWPASDFVGGWANDEELFIEKRNELELGFGDGKGDERQIEAALEQACDHFFSDADRDTDFGVGKAFAKLAQRRAQLIDEGGDTGGEMKRADVFGDVVFESLLDVAHHGDDLLGEFGETKGSGRGDEAFAATNEKFGAELVGEIVELETDGAGER